VLGTCGAVVWCWFFVLPDDQGVTGVANSLTDTGPLLRLQRRGGSLTKAQQYGHPFERPVYSSSIPPRKMQVRLVLMCRMLAFSDCARSMRCGMWLSGNQQTAYCQRCGPQHVALLCCCGFLQLGPCSGLPTAATLVACGWRQQVYPAALCCSCCCCCHGTCRPLF
jgi:hypothetical protein